LGLSSAFDVKNVLNPTNKLIRYRVGSSSTDYSTMRCAVVFDLEFTAWPGSVEHRWLRPGEFREVVQIGAVKIDAETFAEIDALDVLAKPRLNPVLSSYLEDLTGVTNAAVAARGVDFTDAYRAFVRFADGAPIVAFGRDDLVLMDNLALYGLKTEPPLPPHINIVPWLVSAGIDTRGLHACDIAEAAGATFEGRRHDALADARSVMLGIKTLVARGAPNPFLAERHALPLTWRKATRGVSTAPS
jgi:inhibitor of KinA sporulation pathway (predicted exonuclease)